MLAPGKHNDNAHDAPSLPPNVAGIATAGTVFLLPPPLTSAGVSIGMQRRPRHFNSAVIS